MKLPLWLRARSFFRTYTDGVDRRGVRRLFDEDATQAFRALTDGRDAAALPEDPLTRGWIDVRDFFLGLSLKLSPPRRLLFAASLLCPIFGIFDIDLDIGSFHIFLDSAPAWFLLSISGLTLLLALELVDRLRVRDELEVARALQRDLLPDMTPAMPGYRVAHSYQTANEIGGDYYGFLPLPEGRVALAVGDASGHGMAAGLLMAIANAVLESAVDVDPSPQAVLGWVNRTLYRTGGNRAFFSLFYGVLDLETGELEFANAGHPFPLLRRADGTVEEIGQGAFPLGIRPTGSWPQGTVRLEYGDRLMLYSDGIPEAVGKSGDFGFGTLTAMATAPGSAEAAHDRLVEAVRQHLGEEPLCDDITLVVLERLPPLPVLTPAIPEPV